MAKKEYYEDKLRENSDLLLLVADLIRFGSGTIMDRNTFRVEMIAESLAEGEKLGAPHQWTYEIAKLVREDDIESLRDQWSSLSEKRAIQ